MRFLVLGGGAQGTAAAYDLLQQDDIDHVTVADLATGDLHPALAPAAARLSFQEVDATDGAQLASVMEGMDGVLCALPYYLNLEASRRAIDAGAHFADLGGNTAIVEEQRALDGAARDQGVTVTPDTGLAPGLVNILAQAGIEELDTVESVRIWVGGLPQEPEPPLNYQIVYSLEGVLDYYVTPGRVLEGGAISAVEALTGLEMLNFPEPVGQLEAFYTGGGISTMPHRYQGTIDTMEYKTLRYPGHARIMRAVRDLGLLSLDPVDVDGTRVVPRDFFARVVTPALTRSDGNDLVVGRVEVSGFKDEVAARIRYEVLDHYDEETGFTAMMRTTGFSLSLTGLIQARGHALRSGVGTPDEAIPPSLFIEELGRRGISITRSDL